MQGQKDRQRERVRWTYRQTKIDQKMYIEK